MTVSSERRKEAISSIFELGVMQNTHCYSAGECSFLPGIPSAVCKYGRKVEDLRVLAARRFRGDTVSCDGRVGPSQLPPWAWTAGVYSVRIFSVHIVCL